MPIKRAHIAARVVCAGTLVLLSGAASATGEMDAELTEETTAAATLPQDALSEAADHIRNVLSVERAALEQLDAAASRLDGAAPLSAPDPAPVLAALSTDALNLTAFNDADARARTLARDAADDAMAELLLGDAAGAIDLDNVKRVDAGAGGEEWRCLAQAIYFEARGQSLEGQVAVAEVVLNRVDSPSYPDTICGVVRQGQKRLHSCQFSFMCDGRPEKVHEPAAWRLAGKIANLMLSGRPRVVVGAATHFHTTSVNPGWARRLVRIKRVDDHIFYRYPTRVASN